MYSIGIGHYNVKRSVDMGFICSLDKCISGYIDGLLDYTDKWRLDGIWLGGFGGNNDWSVDDLLDIFWIVFWKDCRMNHWVAVILDQ